MKSLSRKAIGFSVLVVAGVVAGCGGSDGGKQKNAGISAADKSISIEYLTGDSGSTINMETTPRAMAEQQCNLVRKTYQSSGENMYRLYIDNYNQRVDTIDMIVAPSDRKNARELERVALEVYKQLNCTGTKSS